MKSFLTAVTAIAAIALGLWLCTFYFGFYIDLHPDAPVAAPFRAAGETLERRTDDGGYETLALRAVDLSASMPGHPFSDGAPEREDYLRWMEHIAQMGANAVQAGQIMDVDFYDALYTYNTTHDTPLYLMQVLPVSDAANHGGEDAYGADFSPKLIRDGKVAVDVIHGRRNVSVGGGSVGYYRSDVSPWTLGYIVGYEWNADTVAYTDHSVSRPESYAGQYVSSGRDASRFEVMLCQVMDEIVSYETDKYKQQRLISFANAMDSDPFEYDEIYARQLSKVSQVDAEHVAQRDFAGFFASYRLYAFCSDPIAYFSAGQTERIGDVIAQVDRGGEYGGLRFFQRPGPRGRRRRASDGIRAGPGPGQCLAAGGGRRTGRGVHILLAGRLGAADVEHVFCHKSHPHALVARSAVRGTELRADGLRAGPEPVRLRAGRIRGGVGREGRGALQPGDAPFCAL